MLSNRELVEHLQGAYQLEEKLLKQRLQALENQTVLNLIEGKPLVQNRLQSSAIDEHKNDSEVLIDELKNDSEILADNDDDDENLEYYGEF